MNGRAAGAVVFAAAAALPALAFATPPKSPTHGVQAGKFAVVQLEHRWSADIGRGNPRDLATILADDYRDIDWQGRVRDKDALLASIGKPSGTSRHTRNLQVRVWGDTAVATGTNEVRSYTQGWTAEVSFTDVFTRIDGHWRAVASQETLRKPRSSGEHG
jgi:hypothetical protein